MPVVKPPYWEDLAAGITAAGDAATEKRATAASHAKATARLTAAHGEDTAERTALTEDVKQVKEAFKALEDGALEVLESQKVGVHSCKSSDLATDQKFSMPSTLSNVL